MNIVLLTHPVFANYQSIQRYTQMLATGMRKRGHIVEIWSPKAIFYSSFFPGFISKWLGYIDQYIIFPFVIRKRAKTCAANTIFVFTDHALGPWVPLLKNKKHIIHCHDFLAQRSALGEIKYNKTKWTGRKYQAFIRNGYSVGKYFISVSLKTKQDLHQFLSYKPETSEVVYNALNPVFTYCDPAKARILTGNKAGKDLSAGYLLHVGGNQWYKNRLGVIEIYDALRSASDLKLPLLLIGEPLSLNIQKRYQQSPFKSDIHVLCGWDDEYVHLAYSGASVFLFPSLAEGFGWPIAEAMASGCPVITTLDAPMTEVGGNTAFYIPVRPYNDASSKGWANKAAGLIKKILDYSPIERLKVIEAGILNAKRFQEETVLNKIEEIYLSVAVQNKIRKPSPFLAPS
jgi:glycosyltransferase involved in cell wall biosynthesis